MKTTHSIDEKRESNQSILRCDCGVGSMRVRHGEDGVTLECENLDCRKVFTLSRVCIGRQVAEPLRQSA